MEKVGVALGGGGARGLAHLGVLRALRRDPRYLPTIIAGTSAGAIVASLYSCGLPQGEIEEAAQRFNWFRHVIRFSDTVREVMHGERGGLVSNAALGDTINALVDYRGFDDLQTDLAIVAADIEHQRRVIFASRQAAQRMDREELHSFLPPPEGSKPGCETLVISDFPDIGMAVRASCAVPGIFLPVEIEGMRLVDGGVVDQVPVDVVRAMGAELTIGVSLSLAFMPKKVNSAVASMAGMIATLAIHQHRKSLELADIGFQLSGIDKRSLVDPRQLDLIDQGEREMSYWLERLERRRGRVARLVRPLREALSGRYAGRSTDSGAQ
ncbi:MAG: patatin-like phospholipase family protein [Spirochaetales bacterium]|nr:patatin-like phospholipase family protein [Spirochaetales bacterium]